MATDCLAAESSLPWRAHSHVQLRDPYSSELIPSFLGRIPEATPTLDLPLLHASRPHFMPPCLLLPVHTFMLPVKAPRDTVSTFSSSFLPHVLDCSFMPSHPHCLVSSCTGGLGAGSVYSLDLHTCRIIQSFTVPAGPSVNHPPLCVPSGPGSASSGFFSASYGAPNARHACPPNTAQPSFGYCAGSRVSSASLHREPSCPLLFLGTSEGDVLAYDLRFPGSSFRPAPCLSLRGAHEGLVSGVRAGSGRFLPAHLFYTSGLVDGWIRVFDLRFPLHYSACSGVCTTAGDVSRGNVPYCVEAVHPNPNFSVHGRCGSGERTANTGSNTKLSAPAEHAREAASVDSPMRRRHCLCCSSSSSGGIAGIDLSPDGALLAVAHVRMAPPNPTEAEDGSSPQVNAHSMSPQGAASGVADRWQLPLAGHDEETSLQGENDTAVRPTVELLETEDDTEKQRYSLEEHNGSRWRQRMRREFTRSERRRGTWRGAMRESGRLEGETIVYSISEGLRALKTLAVADACAFTGVEFSANGKYILQTGGYTNGSACMICQSCTCCCCCCDFLPNYASYNEDVCSPVVPVTPSDAQPQSHNISAQHTPVTALFTENGAPRIKEGCRGKKDERSEQEPSTGKRLTAFHPRLHPHSAQEPSHRAQIVNLVQCNRVALLKSPADGALAFADTSLVKHGFVSESIGKSRTYTTRPSPVTVAGHPLPPDPQALLSGSDEVSSVSGDAGDADDCFTLKLHVSNSLMRASAVAPAESSGFEGGSVDMGHSLLPLHLTLYSPSSRLMDRRRQAFWQTESGIRSSRFCSGHFKRNGLSRLADELLGNVKKSFQRQHIQGNAYSRGHLSANASCSAPHEFLSGVLGSSSFRRRTRKEALEQRKDRTLLPKKRRLLPFPRCNSQSSLFLTACGVLHPQWGRPDCFSQRFLCTFWGGLVAGLGGSRVYPGLKLWHPATGVVLTCAEGPLATQQAVRCVRGHPDLSLGILATGGSVRFHSAAGAASVIASGHASKPNIRVQLSGDPPTRFSGRCSGKHDASGPLRHAKVSCAAVTLWGLEHRDRVLECALNDNSESIRYKGSLRVDPSDEEQEF